MFSRNKISDGAKGNAKPSIKNNPLKYMLGKIAPSIFGIPMHFQGTLRDEFGNIKQVVHVYNTFTTAGKNGLADQMLASPTLGKPTHMAVGTSTGGTTGLTTENDRNALTSKTRSGAVVTMVGDWAAGDATASLTEAGVFDASSTGNMWLYTSFGVVTKGASDTFQISWTFTVS
jgi:hypothetical protein